MGPSRAFMKNAKCVVVKTGTAVLTEPDGKLARDRLVEICEQVKQLRDEGRDVVLVTSGAVAQGRESLSSCLQKTADSSSESQMQTYRNACAAVGQSKLIVAFSEVFEGLLVKIAQILVTNNDFADPGFKAKLSETLHTLLLQGVIPVINENDAISSKAAPSEESGDIFSENDGLAGLIARVCGADLLILLSDVKGLYTGPPSDPNSELIHTYFNDAIITYGEGSKAGKGGMMSKVKAAWHAASAGIPVVIASGFAPDVLLRVTQGECVGTLFHKNASIAREILLAAWDSIRRLQSFFPDEHRHALLDIAIALLEKEDLIKPEMEPADLQAVHQY
ncbi:unnamed protein product [Calypogeia fissa]